MPQIPSVLMGLCRGMRVQARSILLTQNRTLLREVIAPAFLSLTIFSPHMEVL
jgi:hypothetical protein